MGDLESEVKKEDLCIGCESLKTQPYVGDGGVYQCAKFGDEIVGKFGPWTEDEDLPRRLKIDCYKDKYKKS